MTWSTSAALAGLILVGSVMFAMLGLGGAMVFVPLMHWLGFDLKTVAIPLGLALNTLNTGLALIPYSRQGLVDWHGIWPMAACVILAAPLGALTVPYTDRDLLLGLFAFALLGSALGIQRQSILPPAKLHSWTLLGRWTAMAGAGIGIGFLAGLLGVGGGFLVAPLLLALGYSTKATVGSSALVVTFSSLSGFVGHLGQGHFPPLLTAITLSAVLIGSLIGTQLLLRRAHPRWLNKAYSGLLVLIAIRLAWESLS